MDEIGMIVTHLYLKQILCCYSYMCNVYCATAKRLLSRDHHKVTKGFHLPKRTVKGKYVTWKTVSDR